jgi:hypothetical protein
VIVGRREGAGFSGIIRPGMAALQDLPLDQLRAHRVATFRQGGGSRPDVLLIEVNGERAVLKDYGAADPWFSRWIGPLSIRREARALRQLDGVHGVPRLIRVVGPLALLMEHLPGEPVRGLPPGTLPDEFFARFTRLVDAMHARGVAHCDLRSEGNILRDAAGDPYAVDLVAHFRRPRFWNLPMRWLYGKFCQADRVSIARLKHRHRPQSLTEWELSALARDRKTWLERGARMFGKSVRNLSRWLLTHRRHPPA